MLTVTDLFCGAGGSSTGIVGVPGLAVRTAMNHWQRAIETHGANHPDTDHVCADIQQTDPEYIPATDILWASPECTNHSVAKGRRRASNQRPLFGGSAEDAAAIKSRATMWDVPRFAEVHRYRLIMTENVVDAARWVMFDAWLSAMKALGYNHHVVYLNSMHAQLGGMPAPQSRDRMYVVFWLEGNPRPDFDRLRPLAYCPDHGEGRAMQVFKKAERWGRYRAQYHYRCPHTSCRNRIVEPGWLPASSAIDWTLPAERIGDRAKPLADKTMARIAAGLAKYGPRRMAVDAVRGAAILSDVDRQPFRTQTTSYTRGLLVPVEGREGKDAQPSQLAMRTQTTSNQTGIPGYPEAYLMRNNTGGAEMTTPVHEPMRTLLASGAEQSLLMPYDGSSRPQSVTEPIGTLTTVDRYAMITLRGQNAPKHVGEPMDTFAANGNHHGLLSTEKVDVEDCTFRMLEPHEVTRGMAFPSSYVMLGTKREQVKQAGNAVTPPTARDLAMIAAESLGVAA